MEASRKLYQDMRKEGQPPNLALVLAFPDMDFLQKDEDGTVLAPNGEPMAMVIDDTWGQDKAGGAESKEGGGGGGSPASLKESLYGDQEGSEGGERNVQRREGCQCR